MVALGLPLAMAMTFIILDYLGMTLNLISMLGLIIVVGMLVDDATVEVENVHRNMAMGKDIVRAILDGAEQVAMPALVSTMSICIVRCFL